jgi:hypothetical protein
MKYKLEVISSKTVTEHPDDVNTAFDYAEELPLPEDDKGPHFHHDLSLTFFGRHMELILASRRIDPSQIFIVRLSPTIIRTVLGMILWPY